MLVKCVILIRRGILPTLSLKPPSILSCTFSLLLHNSSGAPPVQRNVWFAGSCVYLQCVHTVHTHAQMHARTHTHMHTHTHTQCAWLDRALVVDINELKKHFSNQPRSLCTLTHTQINHMWMWTHIDNNISPTICADACALTHTQFAWLDALVDDLK